uniref:Uncharacterized protein n=1 Tax=Populus trichocarpa TaxID=3694 RepID=U5FH37_POPTR
MSFKNLEKILNQFGFRKGFLYSKSCNECITPDSTTIECVAHMSSAHSQLFVGSTHYMNSMLYTTVQSVNHLTWTIGPASRKMYLVS